MYRGLSLLCVTLHRVPVTQQLSHGMKQGFHVGPLLSFPSCCSTPSVTWQMLPRSFYSLCQPVAARCVPLHRPPRQLSGRALRAAGQCNRKLLAQQRSAWNSHRLQATSARMGDVFFLDDFAIRQWDDPSHSGTRIKGAKQAFVDEIHRQHGQAGQTDARIASQMLLVCNLVCAVVGASLVVIS